MTTKDHTINYAIRSFPFVLKENFTVLSDRIQDNIIHYEPSPIKKTGKVDTAVISPDTASFLDIGMACE